MKKLITAMLCLMIAVCGCGAGQSSADGMEAGQKTMAQYTDRLQKIP